MNCCLSINTVMAKAKYDTTYSQLKEPPEDVFFYIKKLLHKQKKLVDVKE